MSKKITEVQILGKIDDCHDNVRALADLLALVTYSAGGSQSRYLHPPIIND